MHPITFSWPCRYAVRLLYDESSLGEVGSLAELVEYLQDYDSNYFIGSESETSWEEGIRTGKPNLFSLGRDPEKVQYSGTYCTPPQP